MTAVGLRGKSGSTFVPVDGMDAREVDPDAQHAARLTVCAHSRDAEDARELLTLLGLVDA